MAIARGAGTEIIRTTHMRVVDSTVSKLIIGVQHHIYTVLSIIVHDDTLQAAGNYVKCSLIAYGAKEGNTQDHIDIFKQDMQADQTFVWNDKFSFNGYEPVDFVGPMDDATKQDAIADQGGSVSQYLQILSEHASDDIDVICTYIDQNNA